MQTAASQSTIDGAADSPMPNHTTLQKQHQEQAALSSLPSAAAAQAIKCNSRVCVRLARARLTPLQNTKARAQLHPLLHGCSACSIHLDPTPFVPVAHKVVSIGGGRGGDRVPYDIHAPLSARVCHRPGLPREYCGVVQPCDCTHDINTHARTSKLVCAY